MERLFWYNLIHYEIDGICGRRLPTEDVHDGYQGGALTVVNYLAPESRPFMDMDSHMIATSRRLTSGELHDINIYLCYGDAFAAFHPDECGAYIELEPTSSQSALYSTG